MYEKSIVKLHTNYIQYNSMVPFEIDDNGMSIGTAFFIDKNKLLTCYHCVENSINLYISFPKISRKEYEVELQMGIPEMDIAILKLKDIVKDHEVIELGDSDTVENQDKIIAIGYPRNSDSLKFTEGIVSGKHNELLQIDASINPGNSGGPLIKDNKVVGINSSKLIDSENMGFSIPINFYKQWANNKDILIRLPWINIKYCHLGEEGIKFFQKKGYPYESGILVIESLENTIKKGDIIYSINEKVIDNYGYIENKTNKIPLKKYIKQLVYNQVIPIVGWNTTENNSFTRKLTIPMVNEMCKIKNIYPNIEKYEYTILGGIIFMQLTKNHLNDLIEDETISARLKFSLFEYNQTDSESVVFISSILPGSTVNSIELIEPGDIVLNINGETIKTIADVKKGLSNPIDGNILIYCNKNKLFIHPIEKLLEIDKSLKERYNF